MGFKEEHEKWLANHIGRRSGERKDRLVRGHGHGERMFVERIWWLLLGHFKDLHPEYEVLDWRGRPYYIDFVWKLGYIKFAFEIKGYGAHVQEMDRTRYRRELNRETYLQIQGFRVISIAYDDLEQSPELVLTLLKSLLSPYMAIRHQDRSYTRLERDILSLALRMGKPIRPIDLVTELEINHRTATRGLKSLCERGKLQSIPSENGTRVNRYEYIHAISDEWGV